MKIVAGMGSVDDYESFVEAGADEVFIGYVPDEFILKYPNTPLNRREVNFVNVNIGSKSELLILKGLVDKYHVPVTIAFNGLSFMPEQYDEIAAILKDCISCGFYSFIIADMGLLVFLNEAGITGACNIYISGELGEINSFLLKELERLGAKRIIFHRHVSLENMRTLINVCNMEYEAFFMNEKCHYHGGYCNSCHADELISMCRMPMLCTYMEEEKHAENGGLCALWDLREAGVNCLKIVGRGEDGSKLTKDIKIVRKALNILGNALTRESFIQNVREKIFDDGSEKYYY